MLQRITMALTKEEAVLFLQDVLLVPDSLCSEQRPSLSFLDWIIKSYQNVVPWQSVTSWAVPHSQRHLPTWEEIKERQFAKQGGMCYENNMFMKELLSALNFDVYYISCQFWDPDDHMAVIARGMTGNFSRHLVDVGTVCPLFQAIPFDFETDSVEYDFGFLRQRFVKTNGVTEWQHSRRYPTLDECSLTKQDEWYKIAQMKADTPCDVDVFKTMMTIRYTMLEKLVFFHQTRTVVHKNNKLIFIKGMQLVKANDDNTVEKKKMENTEEVVQAYKTYFPQISPEVVQGALKNIAEAFKE